MACGESAAGTDGCAYLQQQQYPGNIRELRNVVIRSTAESADRTIGKATLLKVLESAVVSSSDVSTSQMEASLTLAAHKWACHALATHHPAPFQTAAEILERELITAAIQQTRVNRSAAAQLLGIHRETLRDKLQKHSLPEATE